jgi:NAD-reducing hydrogenase large subunit
MTERLIVNEILDPAAARVIVERDHWHRVVSARFDLTGLPRVDSLLAGRPVGEVPPLVERLCGICPAAHHLAGIQALEALYGITELTKTADAVRRLLHHAAVLSTHSIALLTTDRDAALALGKFARKVMAAAGSPGHFPTTAVIGGVTAPVSREARDACQEDVKAALIVAQALVTSSLGGHEVAPEISGRSPFATVSRDQQPSMSFTGQDLSLTDQDQYTDLLGRFLSAVTASDLTTATPEPVARWDELVAESIPGSPAPRPYLIADGPQLGRYRVGPVAQLRAGTLSTPLAGSAQVEWEESAQSTPAARAVMMLYCVEEIGRLLDDRRLTGDQLQVEVPSQLQTQVGIGVVDSARGLLVHRYQVDDDGSVNRATILTPTAQNEPWLAEMLQQVLSSAPPAADRQSVLLALENAIREADPCLPCAAAPPGTMGLTLEETPVGSN